MATSKNMAMFNSPVQGDPVSPMQEGDPHILYLPPDTKKPLRIQDTRKIDGVTGKPVSDTNRLTRDADVDIMSRIIRKAKQAKIDPYTALALAHQETGMAPGGDTEWNPFHLIDNRPDDLVDAGIKTLKDKMDYARRLGKTNEADIIQGFNGYGKVGKNTEGKQKMMYGIDVSQQPIDMNRNPVYGKRIIDIRDNILKKNPDIVKLVSETN